jgi:hypothetical protein
LSVERNRYRQKCHKKTAPWAYASGVRAEVDQFPDSVCKAII